MPDEGHLHPSLVSVVFATNDAEIAFGRGGATGNRAWRTVRVVIAKLSSDQYGVLVASAGPAGVGPILSCVMDEGLMYEADEFHRMINLIFYSQVRVVHSPGTEVTLQFRHALEFHECLRTLTEVKSLVIQERARLLEQLEDVYAEQFRPPAISRPLTPVDADMDDIMGSPPTSPTSPTSPKSPTSPTTPTSSLTSPVSSTSRTVSPSAPASPTSPTFTTFPASSTFLIAVQTTRTNEQCQDASQTPTRVEPLAPSAGSSNGGLATKTAEGTSVTTTS